MSEHLNRLPPNYIRLSALAVEGFLGISWANPVALSSFGHITVFIGPNNAGKSIPFRFVHLVARVACDLDAKVDEKIVCLEPQTDLSLWWRRSPRDISGTVVFDFPPDLAQEIQPLALGMLGRGGTGGQFSLAIQLPWKTRKLRLSPQVEIQAREEGVWEFIDLVDQDAQDSRAAVWDIGRQQYLIGNRIPDLMPIAKRVLVDVFSRMRFFDPVRALDRTAGVRGMDDGAKLIEELDSLFRAGAEAQRADFVRRTTLNLMNLVLESSGLTASTFQIAIDSGDRKEIFIGLTDGLVLPLRSLGTGVAQLFMICSSIALDRSLDRSMMYFIEEPETHLHPTLLRRFMELISGIPDIQFFLTTHSSVVLNGLTNGDKVFQFSRSIDDDCIATACDGFIEKHRVLDRLGFNGASLLQSNCVIWVEGPSDRVYIRNWLSQLGEIQGTKVREGVDYAFAFCGGKVLSHFSLDEYDVDLTPRDLVSMLAISRYSAVVMDRDISSDQPLDSLRQAKKLIIEAAQADKDHRAALVTDGREIENDVPIELFRKALSGLNSLKLLKLDELILAGEAGFWEEIGAYLEATQQGVTLPKTAPKVELANLVVMAPNQNTALPTWLKELYEFVLKARTG